MAASVFPKSMFAEDVAQTKSGYMILEAGTTKKYSTPLKGKVAEVLVKPHQMVIPNQKLFTLDTSRIYTKYDIAKKEYLLELKLYVQTQTGRLKRVDYSRKAELEKAFHKFKAMETLLSLHETKATHTGIIESVSVVQKQLVRQEELCLTVSEIDTLKFKTPLYADDIRQGASIDLLIEFEDKEQVKTPKVSYVLTKGNIKSLSNERGISLAKNAIQIPQLIAEIEINNAQLKFTPGMKVYVAGTKSFQEILESSSQLIKPMILQELTANKDNLALNQLETPLSTSGLELINKQFEELFSEQGNFSTGLTLPYADAEQLINQFQDLPVDMQSTLQELSATYPELAEISRLSEEVQLDEFQQALQNGEFDDIDFDVAAMQDYLKLSEEETKSFLEYKADLKLVAFEENVDLDYLETLDKSSGVAEYKQQLLELEHIETKLKKEEISKLAPEKLLKLNEDVFQSIGMPALFNQNMQEALSLDPEMIADITHGLQEKDPAAFSHLETLVQTTLSEDQLKKGFVDILEKRNKIIQEERRKRLLGSDDSGANADDSTNSARNERRSKKDEKKKNAVDSPTDELGSDDVSQEDSEAFDLQEFYKLNEHRILPLSIGIVLVLSGIFAFLKYKESLSISIFKKKLRVHEIEVGPDKIFKTINAAIQSVQNIYQEKKKPKFDLVQISVDADDYFEQIDCEWSHPSLIKICSSSEIPFRLTGIANMPCIRIINAPGVMLEGLEIAGESTHAIELQSCTGSVVLKDLSISGFKKTGILISKDIYEGEIKLALEKVEMFDAGDQARGLTINSRCYADFEAIIEHVKFIGTMELGIEIVSPIRHCKIQECVFAKMQYGIVLTSVMEPFHLLQIINNTFHALEYGIVAERLDGLMVQAKQIHQFNNLFTRIAQAEFTIIKEANDQVMAVIFESLYKFSEGNLTDGEPFFNRSSERVLIFQNPRLDKYLVQFVSENTMDKNYLMPNTNEKVRSHLLSFRGSRPYLGGVPPRGYQDRLYDLAVEIGQQRLKK